MAKKHFYIQSLIYLIFISLVPSLTVLDCSIAHAKQGNVTLSLQSKGKPGDSIQSSSETEPGDIIVQGTRPFTRRRFQRGTSDSIAAWVEIKGGEPNTEYTCTVSAQSGSDINVTGSPKIFTTDADGYKLVGTFSIGFISAAAGSTWNITAQVSSLGSDTEEVQVVSTTAPYDDCEDDDECECTAGVCEVPDAESCGSPVYVKSGNLRMGRRFKSSTDLLIPEIGLPLEITRFYNNQLTLYNGPFGRGWTSNYTVYLSEVTEGIQDYVDIHLVSSSVLRYEKNGATLTPVKPDVYDVLIDNGDGTYTLNPNSCPSCNSFARNAYNFNTNGQLTSIEDLNGNALTITYDVINSNQIDTVTGPSGQTLTFAYNVDDKIYSVTDPGGRTVNYDYDANGNLTSVTDPLGNDTIYGYEFGDPEYRIISITDKDGRTAFQVIYDTLNRVTSYAEYGATYTYTYGSGTTTKSDSLGRQWVYTYDSNDNITNIQYPDGSTSVDTIDASINVTARTDANNNTTDYTYNSKGQVLTKQDALSNTTIYSYYDSAKFLKLDTVTDALGSKTKYDYDSYGNRISEQDALGDTTIYSYDNYGQLLRVTDKRGNITRYEYNAYGDQTKVTDALGDSTLYSYDTWGNRTKMTDARGKVTCYEYDALNRMTKEIKNVGDTDCGIDADDVVSEYGYDGVGNRISVTDPRGNVTTYTYGSQNRLTSITDDLGNTTSYEYDAEGNKTKQTDAEGKVTCYDYDSRNRLSKEIRNVGDTDCGIDADDVVIQYAYDSVGNRTSVTDPRGNITYYAYDELNRLYSQTDALVNTTLYSFDAVGNQTRATDAEGKIIRFEYDDLNRKTKEIKEKTGTDAETLYSYDENSNITTMTDPNGNSIGYTYDALNRRTQMTNALSENELYSYDEVGNRTKVRPPNGNVVTNTYDDLNRLTGVSDSLGTLAGYVYDKASNRTSETDANSNTTTYTYDDINRLTQVTDALSNNTIYSYDKVGNRLRVTDREGNITTFDYDDLQRLTSTTRDPGGLDITTSYEYDKNGNRTGITDDNNNATIYTYDVANHLTQETYADGKTVTYTYNGVGNRLTRVDQNGNTTTYTYDDLHRLTGRDYPGSNDDSFTYDLGSRMATADNSISSVRYAYDNINRATQERQNGEAVAYVYNTASRTRVITYPGTRVITETRDLRNRMDTVVNGGTIADYTYSGARLSTVDYLNGATATYSYNADNWVTTVSHYKGAAQISEFGYGFDNEGNRKYAERFHDSANSEQYTYNKVYRLTDFKRGTLVGETIPTPVTQTAYSLDGVGNWNSKSVTPGSTEFRTHNEMNEIYSRGTSSPYTSLGYDDNGNLTDDDTNTYGYDYENRLTSVSVGAAATYKYDPLGRRTEKDTSGTVTKYYYDGARVIEEQVTGSTTATYVYGGGIDEALTMDRGGATYYYHANSLGNMDALTDSSGNVVEYYRYDAYGEPSVYDSGWTPQGSSSTVGNPYLFTGRRLDDETNLYYYRARYYSPTLGRFLQHDPLGYVDGMNLYEYVRGNPVNLIDPMGIATYQAGFEPPSRWGKWTKLGSWEPYLGKSAIGDRYGQIQAELHYGQIQSKPIYIDPKCKIGCEQDLIKCYNIKGVLLSLFLGPGEEELKTAFSPLKNIWTGANLVYSLRGLEDLRVLYKTGLGKKRVYYGAWKLLGLKIRRPTIHSQKLLKGAYGGFGMTAGVGILAKHTYCLSRYWGCLAGIAQ